MTTLVRLLLHRHRMLIGCWTVLLVGLSGVTVSAYQSTYSTPEERRQAVELAQHNAGGTLLYGRLPGPGTPAQMFAWEAGAIVTLLAALMAALLAVAVSRAAEEDGTLETLLTCGTDLRTPIRSAAVVLGTVAAALSAGCALAVGLSAGRVQGVTWPGALLFGAVVGVSFLAIGALTLAGAQIVTTARQARAAGGTAVGLAFAVRGFADTRDAGWLNWLTPLGLRATAQPFTGDRWWAVAVYAAVAAALVWWGGRLAGRREYGTGLLPSRQLSNARLNIASCAGLAGRLSRTTTMAWAVMVACVGTLFSTIGAGAVQQSRQGDMSGFLGAQLASGDPEASYLAYCGTVVGMAVTAFAVLGVLRAGRDEHQGLTDHVLATGVGRWRPLASSVAVTAAGSAAILLITGMADALIAPAAITGDHVAARAFAYTVGQWPSAMAAAGITALLVGLWPRAAWLAWAPLAAGGVLALLGHLLGVPRTVQDLGLFKHVPDIAASGSHLSGLAILLAVSAATTLTGLVAITRRDLTTG